MTTLPSPPITNTRNARQSLGRSLNMLVPILLVIAGYASVNHVQPLDAGTLGIIQAMPPTYFGIVALLVFSFARQVHKQKLDTAVLVIHVGALIVLLHGAISYIEGNPRFPVVYTHVGLTEYIQRTNETLPSLDARMNWPGFFSATAMMDNVAGVGSVYPFLLWAPVAFNLFYAPLIYSITRTATTDPRIPWLTLWMYYTLSWVGQDYFFFFSLNFLFFLTFVAVLLRCFRTDRAALPRPIRRIGLGVSAIVRRILRVPSFQPGGAPILATTTLQRSLLVGALAAIYTASVMSHQLTPVFLLLYVTALVVLRKTVLRGFPLLMAVLFFTFVSYGAIGFWSGHMDQLFGGFGKLGGTVKENVGSKTEVKSTHVYVIYSRLLLAASVWMVAMFGLLRRLRSGRTDIPILVGFIVPFFVLGGQSYGGEVILRVFLFSLPFSAIFIAFALLPGEKTVLSLKRTAIFAIVATLLVPVFWLTRYGNEAFEYISKGDYKGALYLASIAPDNSNMLLLDGNSPNQLGRMDQFIYVTPPTTWAPGYDPITLYNAAAQSAGTASYLLLDRSQVANIIQTYGKPKTFYDDYTKAVLATGKFTLIYDTPDARIFTINVPADQAGVSQ